MITGGAPGIIEVRRRIILGGVDGVDFIYLGTDRTAKAKSPPAQAGFFSYAAFFSL